MERAGVAQRGPDAERDVEPRLGGRDPRRLRDQGEGRAAPAGRADGAAAHRRRQCRGGLLRPPRACRGRSWPSASTQGEARGRTTVGGCSPRRFPNGSAPTSAPPRRWRGASRQPGTRSISWADPCATHCSPTRRRADSDVDLTTDARPDETERLVRGWADDVWTQGARFGTIGARKGTVVYEITTHRAEVYVPESRKPEVSFGDDIVVDLSRRDFTINALALRLPDMELIDPFDGLGDLAAGRLRTPLDPEISFGDDPLRMLRAARFAARFSLEPDPALIAAVRAHARPALHRLGRAHPRRAGQDDHGRRALEGAVVRRADRVGRGLPARAARDGARAGSHPPAQGRPGAHARRRRQDLEEPAAPPRRPLPRRRQAAHARHHRRWCELPPSRGGGGAHDEGAPGGAALPGRGGRHRRAARRAAPALPHVPAGMDRQGGAPLRARRGAPPRPAERADPLRLHHAQRVQGAGPGPAHGRARGPHRGAARAGGARLVAPRPRREPGHGAAGHRARPRRRGGALVPHGAAPRRGSVGRGGGGGAPAAVVGRPEPSRR